jgi:hypothetical protein
MLSAHFPESEIEAMFIAYEEQAVLVINGM